MPYTHISALERTKIMHCHQYGLSIRQIAERLDRAPSTISRELRRNAPACNGSYVDIAAQSQAQERQRWQRQCRRRDNGELTRYVYAKLEERWSPEVISERLKLDYPENPAMRVSAEQVYQWVFADARAGGELFRYLRRHHKRRRRQCRAAQAHRGIKDRVDIDDRPAEVDTRERFGDWEGDTVSGKTGTGCIATHIERKSGFLVATKRPDKQAKTLAHATVLAFQAIPEAFRLTLTYDNGTEFAQFKLVEAGAGFDVYFAKPYSPWQRGCNENANGLLRQFFPKGSDFTSIDESQLQAVVHLLNHRPRKRLGYQTPYEVFPETQSVALAS